MVELNALVVAGVFLLVGGVVLSRARGLRDRSATIDELESAGDERLEPGGEATVRGPVTVAEPASPERTGPETPGTGDPALWAWRLRRKRGTGNGGAGSRWRTVDGGLAVGEFAVDHSGDRVRVDATTHPFFGHEDATDPFEASQLFLGEPATETYLGDLDPINRFLERTGLADDDGVVSDLEVSISVGGRTTIPDKYQATVVREGDELLVRGDLTETADGYVLRGTDETPLVIGVGSLEEQRSRLRSKRRLQTAAGGALIALGALVAVLGIL